MDLRPQGPEIIRTWLFDTVVRAHFEHDALPWRHAAINGWILDPDRKKMSKSKGNVVTPIALLEQYGADAVRYWSASARPGTDTAFDEGQMKIGRRLAIKLLNASRFALEPRRDATPDPDAGHRADRPGARWLVLRSWSTTPPRRSRGSTTPVRWSARRRSSGRSATTTSSWSRVGPTAPATARRSRRRRLRPGPRWHWRSTCCSGSSRPFLPFATEEVWSWWQDGSVHTAPWPSHDDRAAWPSDEDDDVLEVASRVLQSIRRAKSDAKVSMKAPVAEVEVRDLPEHLDRAARSARRPRRRRRRRGLRPGRGRRPFQGRGRCASRRRSPKPS